MASALTDKLSRLVKTLSGQARITESNVADMLREASRTLSSFSHYTGLAMAPRLKATIFRHIEFVKLSPRLVLAVFVTQSGLVQNKLVYG